MKKFGINGQLRNKLFFIFVHRSSIVKAAMNAPRICKIRNQFLLFSIAKAEQRPLGTCQLRRGGVFEA
jgi:hypothetical protein